MRVECLGSRELERSMEMQCYMMSFDEALRHAETIDSLDDKRREKVHNLLRWNEAMQISFSKKRAEILTLTTFEDLKYSLLELDKEINDFNSKFSKSMKSLVEEELYFEEKDDNLRRGMIDYAKRCTERLRDLNSSIESEFMKVNLKNRNTPTM